MVTFSSTGQDGGFEITAMGVKSDLFLLEVRQRYVRPHE